MSGYLYQDLDSVEPISDTFGEQATNAALYNVITPEGGSCALTYDAADMTVDLAAGWITHFGTRVAVSAVANAFTLVSDPTNPRWTWLALSSSGVATQVNGTPASAPTVPELGDNVALALVYVQAGLTIAANATYQLDKRVPSPSAIIAQSYTTQSSTAVGPTDLITLTLPSAIPATRLLRLTFAVGKGSENAGGTSSYFGLKVNSTVIAEADSSHYIAAMSTNNQVEDSLVTVHLYPGATNLQTLFIASQALRVNGSGGAGFIAPSWLNNALTAVIPIASITSITLRCANPGGAGPTLRCSSAIVEVL